MDQFFYSSYGGVYTEGYAMMPASVYLRPSISLERGTTISDGVGTQLDPYEIG